MVFTPHNADQTLKGIQLQEKEGENGEKHVWEREAVVQRCSVKKVFLKISQNSQKNTCAKVSFLIKLRNLRPATLLKKRLWHRCFPVNFVKFPRTPFFTEHLRTTASVFRKRPPRRCLLTLQEIYRKTFFRQIKDSRYARKKNC